MRDSGDRLRLRPTSRAVVDKHSTGGVGDKISLVLAPLMASCGLFVPMISGRGLGHTGGTLDKLQTIPGYRTDLGLDEMRRLVEEVGTVIIGQTSDLAPADRRIYAMRDATSTVESESLIVASILSKKLTEDLDGLVLDVKFGDGAFFTDFDEARKLAVALVETAKGADVRCTAVLTSMEEPLGYTVGNVLEVIEANEALLNKGPADIKAVTFALGAEMLLLGGVVDTAEAAHVLMEEHLSSGKAFAVWKQMIAAQGGDVSKILDDDWLEQAAATLPVCYEGAEATYVSQVKARAVAEVALKLGAGRLREDAEIDPSAGIAKLVKVGQKIEPGQALGVLHGRHSDLLEDLSKDLRTAFAFSEAPPPPSSLIREIIN
jgi:pyrimidine-nucleoside phosphorylase